MIRECARAVLFAMTHASVAGPMLVIGHRGACGHAPENSIASVKWALKNSVAMIEFDVHRCATEELVVIHDATVNRTTNGTGAVAEKTLAQLKQLTLGQNNERIPTLEEFLQCIGRRAIANIELKGANTAQGAVKVVAAFVQKRGWAWQDFLVSSFDHDCVREFHQRLPEVPLGVLTRTDVGAALVTARELRASALIVQHNLLATEIVEQARHAGIPVFTFTINDPKRIKWAIALGVDGIMSDYPDRIT